MRNDFDLIRHSFKGDTAIYPISDVHLGAIEHNKDAWESFCKRIEKEDAYLILDGDLINNSVRTVGFTNPYDELIRPRDQKRMMVEYLKPIKDKVLCIVSGNHERRSMKDDDVDLTYDIASKLDIEDYYRENIAFMTVSCGKRNTLEKWNSTYSFAVTHGSGGGIYTGAAVNRNERFGNIIDGLDILVVGHVHKGFVTRPSKIVIDPQNNKVSQKSYVVISTVPWMEWGGYAAQKMLLPAEACRPQKLILSGSRKKEVHVHW